MPGLMLFIFICALFRPGCSTSIAADRQEPVDVASEGSEELTGEQVDVASEGSDELTGEQVDVPSSGSDTLTGEPVDAPVAVPDGLKRCFDNKMPDVPFFCGAKFKDNPKFCEEHPALAKKYCQRTCGLCGVEGSASATIGKECESPKDIGFVGAHSCEEGVSIASKSYCTPACEAGRTPWVNLSSYSVSTACADDSGLALGKLCCLDGALWPPTYTCVDDLFGGIDSDKSGSISRSEFEAFAGAPREQSDAEKAAIDAKIEDETLQGAGVGYNWSKKFDTPFILCYLVFTSTLLVIVALCCLKMAFSGKPTPLAKTEPQQAETQPPAAEPLPTEEPSPSAEEPPPEQEPATEQLEPPIVEPPEEGLQPPEEQPQPLAVEEPPLEPWNSQ